MQDQNKWMIVLAVASLLAAPPAWTKDEAPVADERIASAAEASKEQARKANNEAAQKASRNLLAATRLDLDIQLIGPTSKKIAGKR